MDGAINKYLITKDGFDLNGCNETCFTVANGLFAVRGVTDELYAEERPGTYAAGVYNKGTAAVRQLVNFPYPFGLRLYLDREPMDVRACRIDSYRRELDMRRGVYTREFAITDALGRRLRIRSRRFASMADRNLAFAGYEIACENFSGVLNAEAFIESDVYNAKGNPNDRARHFATRNKSTPDRLYMECETTDGAYTVGIGSATRVSGLQNATQLGGFQRDFGSFTAQYLEFEVEKGAVVELERFVAVCTNREGADVEARAQAKLEAAAGLGGNALFEAHTGEMERLWAAADIEIEGDPEADRALRFNIYALMCCVNPADERVSIGAKGLHGEGYMGHVFWDTEVFMLPFFIYALPEHARTLLSYRYHTLDGARKNAALGGYRGARYAWESADTGLEETPQWGFDYKGNRVRIWTGDIELHITSDIVHGLREYVRATGDARFFAERAAEIILETARFWVSRLEYNEAKDRYEIRGVIGPDEFHEHVDNNAYTNALAQWNIRYALECAAELGKTTSEMSVWKEIAEKIYIPMGEDGKLIEQFEGYFGLEDRVIESFDANNMPMWPPDVDIAALNKYTLVKQADVVMLLHLLGERFDMETTRENYVYYEKRTMHKSSLGPSTYALMGVKTGEHAKAYANFYRTLMTDLADNQGNAVHGLHGASAGGAWCTVFYGFCGVGFDAQGRLTIDPWLPEHWKAVRMHFHFQGRRLRLTVTPQGAQVERLAGEAGLKVFVAGKEVVL